MAVLCSMAELICQWEFSTGILALFSTAPNHHLQNDSHLWGVTQPAFLQGLCRRNVSAVENSGSYLSLCQWAEDRNQNQLGLSQPWGCREGPGFRRFLLCSVAGDVQCGGCSSLQLLLLLLGDAEIQKLQGFVCMDAVPPLPAFSVSLVLSFVTRRLSSSSHGPCWSLHVLVVNFL